MFIQCKVIFIIKIHKCKIQLNRQPVCIIWSTKSSLLWKELLLYPVISPHSSRGKTDNSQPSAKFLWKTMDDKGLHSRMQQQQKTHFPCFRRQGSAWNSNIARGWTFIVLTLKPASSPVMNRQRRLPLVGWAHALSR